MARIDIRARWAVPAAAVAVTGIVIAAATVASAESAPSLPPRSAAQLVTEIAQGTAKPLGPLTATVQQTSDLGLPDLPAVPRQSGGPSLSSSPETTTIWYRDPQHIRVAEQVPAGETDLRLDGRTLWTWNSKTQTATKYVLPAPVSEVGQGALRPGLPPSGSPKWRFQNTGAGSAPELPQSAAAQVLKAVGPTTIVSVQRNVYVAGRAAYQLSLVPRSSKSLVGSVLIAIDASRHIPLRVEVLSRGSSTVAYSIGFTALSFGAPAASNFSFTPPPGATVKNVTVPGNLESVLGPAGLAGLPVGRGLGGPLLGSTIIGSTAVPQLPQPVLRVVRMSNGKLVIIKTVNGKRVIVKAGNGQVAIGKLARPKLAPPKLVMPLRPLPKLALQKIEAQFAKSLPASMTKAQRAAAIKAFDQHLLGRHLLGNGGGFFRSGALPANGFGFPYGWTGHAPLATAPGNGPHVIGTSWLSVIATPPSPAVAAAIQQMLHGGPGFGQPRTTVTYGSSGPVGSSEVYSSTPAGSPPIGPDLAMLQALLKATVPVHGSWGSGRLLKTTLLNVLVTSKGQILAGAVAPSVLYADVAADAG